MRNFTTQLLAGASMATLALCQIPRECFFVTELHGPENPRASFLSNLPMLEAMYQPGQRLESIVALQNREEGDRLTGLQVSLHYEKQSLLELNTIGAKPNTWDSLKLGVADDEPDRIKIIEDQDGICDVIIYQGNKAKSLSLATKDCQPALTGVKETMLRLPRETPLVGFHGKANNNELIQLGLIMVDTQDPVCLRSAPFGNEMNLYQNMNEYEASAAAEKSITKAEKARASALEAIIVYDSMMKARQSQDEIKELIETLEAKQPISQNIESQADLKDLLTRLSTYDKMNRKIAKSELKELFWQLADFYDEDASIGHDLAEIPLQIKYLKDIYDHFPVKRQGRSPFEGVNPDNYATVFDLNDMLDELAEHYAELSYGPIDDMNDHDRDLLVHIFDVMQRFYAQGDGRYYDGSNELAEIYKGLRHTLSQISQDFHVADETVTQIYEKVKAEEDLDLDIAGTKIQDYSDLIELEQRERDHQMQLLMNELQKVESNEDSTRTFFNQQYHLLDGQIEKLENLMEKDSSRVSQIEKSILLNEQAEEKMQDEVLEAIYVSEKTMPETFKNAASSITPQSYASTEDTGEQTLSDKQVQQIKDLLNADKTVDYIMYSSVVVALIVGVIIGGACLMCIMNCFKRSQKKRLDIARQKFDISMAPQKTIEIDTNDTRDLDQKKEPAFSGIAVKPLDSRGRKLSQKDTFDYEVASPDDIPTSRRDRRQTQLKQLDTEDIEAAAEEGGDKVDSFEMNMEAMLSSRALDVNKPIERRGTTQPQKLRKMSTTGLTPPPVRPSISNTTVKRHASDRNLQLKNAL